MVTPASTQQGRAWFVLGHCTYSTCRYFSARVCCHYDRHRMSMLVADACTSHIEQGRNCAHLRVRAERESLLAARDVHLSLYDASTHARHTHTHVCMYTHLHECACVTCIYVIHACKSDIQQSRPCAQGGAHTVSSHVYLSLTTPEDAL